MTNEVSARDSLGPNVHLELCLAARWGSLREKKRFVTLKTEATGSSETSIYVPMYEMLYPRIEL